MADFHMMHAHHHNPYLVVLSYLIATISAYASIDLATIVRSMIQLGHNLNLQVLVEGVEEEAEVDWLQQAGCDLIQGYYFSRPEKPEQLRPMLQKVCV